MARRRAAYGLMAAAAALALLVAFQSIRQRRTEIKPQMLTLVIHSQNAVWESREPARLAAGKTLGSGRLQLVSGRASLMFTSGATLDFAGPADVALLAADRVACWEGRREGDNLGKLDRPFSGRLAEIAIYGRLLAPEEIRHHAALGGRSSP